MRFSILRTFVVSLYRINVFSTILVLALSWQLFLVSTHVITSRLPPVCCCISDNRWSLATLQRDTGCDKSDIPRTVSETSFRSCVSRLRRAIYIDLQGFRWFSLNAGRPSCLLPREVERCADNARAFSGVIKGLNPRSFVRRMTLILSTTPCEPATEQAINSFVAFRLHDGLAQILSAATNAVCSDKIRRILYVYSVCGRKVGGRECV